MTSTPKYILARLGQAVLVLFLAFTLASLLLLILPGDGVMARFSDPALGLSKDEIAGIRASFGADLPWWQQYASTLLGFLTGDFGFSTQTGAAVSTLVSAALPSTAVLALTGFVSALVLAVIVTLVASYGRFRWLRDVADSLPSLFISVPVFWLGIILVEFVSFRLGWINVVDPGPFESLILPSVTIALPISAPIAQVLIRSVAEVRAQPYVRVTRAKGAAGAWLFVHAVLRNAISPALTIAGLVFGELVAGAVVTETVFGRNGIGALTAQAVANRDNPVLLTIVVIATLGFVIVNLLVDLLYPLIDPRLRTRKAAA
ncbi:ABC transporter permease [Brevibacterium sp. 50QC2O2]|jgi:peptide/nickel transport system permease protein|uniref:ABC transporter permease n=1 Tax=Brevibacterium TaxID=1696 RepID=UPI00211C4698|nr:MULTISPECIES: ABC transporter permease [unclassified Brevibacterium]MCQ9367724.1 ABC transporter permease [Brevibacterium sp. 91QC2O2]MCQ9384970.1 ABC transporter permease [Brevibacterium sp. 68QC2CO]MCQ9387983.1 ABC transporter permease [Brevibacterium sp. 50QC2O2]